LLLLKYALNKVEMKRRCGFIVLFLLWATVAYGSESLKKVALVEDSFLLLDVAINRQTIASTVDAYRFNERVVIAIEPLFDSLKLRYQLTDTQLKIWKDDEAHIFELSGQVLTNELLIIDTSLLWASDGYYQFVELKLLEILFGVKIETDLSRQVVNVINNTTHLANKDKSTYLFPVQKLALLSERRQTNRFYNTNASYEEVRNAITIADQYSLITPPSGRVNLRANLADQKFNGSLQLVSDFLYHSANLTLSQSDNSDLAASLNLSRFKSSPDDRILGLFDSYRLGDVSGVSNNLTTGGNKGIGVIFQRAPDDFRRKNLEVTLDELAPPGWDAELFRSGVFLDRRVVPDDGRLIYEDVELFYGLNDFEIRLYGPFGEEDVITNRINVKQNALAKGQVAYSLNALDKNHRLFNDDNDDPYQITNFGGSFDIGITDRWQLGVAFASIDSEQQFVSMKNALSFNNFLFENDLSVNQDGSYAQQSSVTGSLFNKHNYTLAFESAKNFESDIISAQNDDYSSVSASYSLPTYIGLARFGAGVQNRERSKRSFFTNQLSTRISIFSLTHNLRYSKSDLLNQDDESTSIDSFLGGLGVSASIPGFSVSANLNYNPEESDPILKSSSIQARKTLVDPFDNKHYFQAQYFPLSDVGRKWAIIHSLGWLSEDYQLTYSSSYDSNDNWDVNLGLRFFLGYDHRNKRFIMDREFSGGSATLDVHTYLDRQLNGVPDVLDYNLPDVAFRGNPRWTDYQSNEDGRTILPGVYANSEFAFSGKWQEGSATYNQDYVVYTHPGAYVDVNMPFYLITDLTGFVVRQQGGQEIALRNVEVQLFDAENQLLQTYETDQDGYYEFLNLAPNAYTLRVGQGYLREKGFTGDVIGIKVATSGKGGFVELPTLVLQRNVNAEEYRNEGFTTLILNEENVDALVWDNDKKIDRNYFTLPRKEKGKLMAPYSLTQANPQTNLQAVVEPLETISPASRSVESPVIDMPRDDAVTNNKERQLFAADRVLTRHGVKQKVENTATTLPKINIRRPEQTLLQPADTVNAGSNVVTQSFNLVQPNLVTGWIIQFSANRQLVDNALEVEKYSKIGALYVAQKVNGVGEVYNCVISQIYSSKQFAIEALGNSGLSGWVINSENYSDFKAIN
jgi:hypothetical protein